ncbi:MAG: CvpA family protein [Pirellulales bacterium]|nr:CvpA family protein [Pirellulales bacterium]
MSYDLFMIVILACCVILGAVKGMAWQLASLSSLVVSYLVAQRFSGTVAPMISTEEPWNTAIAMLILFAATSLVIWILFRGVRGMIERFKLKEFDRQLGAVVGGVKGAAICIVITFFAVTLSETARSSVLESRSGYYISVLLEKGHDFLPERMHEQIHSHYVEFQAKLSQDGKVPSHRHDEHASSADELPAGDALAPDKKPLNGNDITRRIDEFFKDSQRR